VPALVAASPWEQRTVAQRSAAAVREAAQAAHDAGYRLDKLLAADARPVQPERKPNTPPATPTKTARKAKSTSSHDGTGATPAEKKSAKTKGKGAKKKSTPGDRKR
jgi:transcriptional regulator of nitric oxide reductase